MSQFFPRFICSLICVSISFFALSQRDDANFLRDFKAPDFKYRQLRIISESQGNAFSTSTQKLFTFTLGSDLGYYQFSNRKKYQGVLSTSGGFDLLFNNTVNLRSFGFTSTVSNITTNRFYLNEKWFIGVYDESTFFSQYNNTDSDSLPVINNYSLNVKPAISVGFGRVEWVQFGRQAMDIERSLEKFNRLNHAWSDNERKMLADKIAHIRNRRYYDVRLGRIDQLQALDSLLNNEGYVSDDDIVYFSQLQDAFLYSYYTTRLSGYRHELGITQGLDLTNGVVDNAMSLGFYTFSWYLPQSYAIQHNLEISLLSEYIDYSPTIPNSFTSWVDFSYEFGLYPTTRTYLGITAKSGMNISSAIGYMSGLTLDGYYYLSPRVRFWATGGFIFGENYDAHNFGHVAVFNLSQGTKGFDYSFRAGFSYDIF